MNFVNDNTDWFKRRAVLNTRTHFRHSYKEVNEFGIEVEKGYLSEVHAISFKDNAFKGIGDSALIIGFEEAGKFDNLTAAITISGEPLVRDGEIKTGSILVWGSAGDMDRGSIDLCDIFYNPTQYGFKSYANIYDEETVGECGWFIDDLWYSPGTYKDPKTKEVIETVDTNGNSIRDAALKRLMAKRERRKKGTKNAYQLFVTQQPIYAKEAFLRAEGGTFPAIELQRAVARLKGEKGEPKPVGTAGWLSQTEEEFGRPKFIPDLEGKLKPIRNFPLKSEDDILAALVIYEFPPVGKIPRGMYTICTDPVAIDGLGGKSMNATFVYKARNSVDNSGDVIVATYVGRTPRTKEYNRNLLLISQFYGNAKIAFENDRGTIKSDFENWKKLHHLSYQSNTVIAKVIGNSQLDRIYGNSMSSLKMKAAAEIYLYDWLLTPRGRDKDNNKIYNLDLIPDITLLEELIRYTREDATKFDRVMAMFQLMLVIEEDFEKIIETKKNSHIDEIAEAFAHNPNMFNPIRNNRRNVRLPQAKTLIQV